MNKGILEILRFARNDNNIVHCAAVLLGNWQSKIERAAFAGLALDPDAAAVRFEQHPGDVKVETQPAPL